jgi:uncharacterized protein YsxB (DUF464 family)
MRLKEILGNLAKAKDNAKIDPASADPRVAAGVEAMARNAINEIEQLTQEYKNEVIKHVVLVALNGEKSQEFAEKAKELTNALIVDFEQVKKDISNNLKTRQASPIFNNTTYYLLLDELNKIKVKNQILSIPTPILNLNDANYYELPIEDAVSKLLDKAYAGSLSSVITRNTIANTALEHEFCSQYLPVLVYNVNQPIDTQFLPQAIITHQVDNDFTLNDVKSLLDKIKSAVAPAKKSKKKADNEVEDNNINQLK